ncbi:protein of unknown function DUF190 [Thermocrinis albus DSM 14484]|uniref:Uncharacterized protein n=1 Tax=Thermocrinis albus (strain DSM 14484 / JCM 11386 / HI 11/12) TaxID=638303 RepID=D3SME4_THEAH|nr:DUF190 domain-containing protein [Thermocrinis albus]ADC89924.1 protein of unknown function DUF190 [Thermocrinis albus DSM 14484]
MAEEERAGGLSGRVERRTLVRIFLQEDEGYLLIKRLREKGFEGATLLKAILGYGTTGKFHYEGIEVLSYGLPAVVEVVEREERLNELIRLVKETVKSGTVTLEEVLLWES